ncbi:MAG: UDP-N-acetylglucosamine 2-epimerase (non-hydrolyzing) [Myxococcales bacterium]|nr:UDP-N-acetylglucosamine 2-epimerase (non-hydrolyzing) [Myxococcales bacterium]
MKILNIVGARPNFVKIAPIMEAYKAYPDIEPILVHTGQHYDKKMSDSFFETLGIPDPDVHLGIGSGSHAAQTAAIMVAFEPIVLEHKPDALLVVGDVNSTVACSLVATKLHVPVIHVEAGLRSHDRGMPEEVNRIVTDAISSMLFCTEESGVDNLRKEGVPDEKIFFTGNVMIDTLVKQQKKLGGLTTLEDLGVQAGGYGLLTLHRPSNVDDPEVFARILDALEVIQQDLPLLFPMHPRTRNNMQAGRFGERIQKMTNLRLLDPLDYLGFLHLMSASKVVLTDSGGIQEETTYLKVPCITIRENTERPITCEIGSNQLVGTQTERILEAYQHVHQGTLRAPQVPPLWDGRAAERIVAAIHGALSSPA